MHAFGAALDHPGLVVACVIGDGEAETGPLAASWRGHAFLNPVTDGAVLPILHLNGFKIANPTLLARIPEAQLVDFLRGNGYEPLLVSGGFDGEDPMAVHARIADAVDVAYERIASIRADAAAGAFHEHAPRWPASCCAPRRAGPARASSTACRSRARSTRTRCRSLACARTPSTSRCSRRGCGRTGPRSCSTPTGGPVAELDALRPRGELRMSATPARERRHRAADLELPPTAPFAVDGRPGGARRDRRGDAGLRRVARRRDAGEPR